MQHPDPDSGIEVDLVPEQLRRVGRVVAVAGVSQACFEGRRQFVPFEEDDLRILAEGLDVLGALLVDTTLLPVERDTGPGPVPDQGHLGQDRHCDLLWGFRPDVETDR